MKTSYFINRKKRYFCLLHYYFFNHEGHEGHEVHEEIKQDYNS